METVDLPKVVEPDGLSPRDYAVKEAHDWQVEVEPSMTKDGVFTPSRPYNIIVGLLDALFTAERERDKLRRKRR